MPDKWAQYAQPAIQPTDVQKTPNDPWMKYAVQPSSPAPVAGAGALGIPQPPAHAASPLGTPQPTAPKASPSLLDRVNQTFANNPGPGQPGGYSEALRPVGNVGRRAVRDLAGQVAEFGHKITTPSEWGFRLTPGDTRPEGPGLGDMVKGYLDTAHTQGPMQALTDVGGDALAMYAGNKAIEGAMRAPGAAKRFVTGDVHAPIPGSSTTPADRYQAAKRLGVQLDAADATNSPVLNTVKHLNENSLFGGGRYETLKGANTGALTDATDQFLNELHPGDRESGGRTIQQALKADHARLRTGAESGFDMLSEQTKGKPVKGAPEVGKTAKSVLSEIAPLADKYPSLAPGKTMTVLEDLSRVGGKAKPAAPVSFLDAPGSEFAVPREPVEPPKPDTWSDLQKLRSATHDLTTSNPDLVKSQAIAPLQRMTQALDEAMTNGSSGLNPQQAEIFRDANAQWKDMKGTYDDPASPFYHAVRNDNPSTLYSGVGPKTPENAINLRRRLSPSEDVDGSPAPALGALRRGTVESALKPNNEGAPNFRTFGMNLNRVPADYRAELFSPEQNARLRDINHTSNVLAKDFNPSGSGKLGQKVAEAAALVPTAGLPALQYPVARMMTSPKVVDWMMKPSVPVKRFTAPTVTSALLGASSRNADQ